MKPIKIIFGKDKLTSFAGLNPFMKYLDQKLNLFELFDRNVSFTKKVRNYTKVDYFKVLLTLLTVGYEKLAHVFLIHNDAFILKMFNLTRLPNPENIVRCFLDKFSFKHAYELSQVQQILVMKMHRSLFRLKSVVIDCDSTPKDTCGHQQGTGIHYKNKNGYHPLLAFIAETKEFLHGFLRPGYTYTGNGIVRFVTECLTRLPYYIRYITFRADSGFFNSTLMTRLEKLGHFYVIAAKLYPTLSQQLDIHGEDQNEYQYQVYCTNRIDLTAAEVVEFYRDRATSENYIKEAKSDTRFIFFTVQKFWSNEAIFQTAMLLYNASIWFRAELISKNAVKERLYTFRLKYIIVPGRLITSGRQWFLRVNECYRYRNLMETIEFALN